MSKKLKDLYAVILCGGKGTRLRSVVSDRPKPMAQVADRPFLDIIIDLLERNGIRNIVLSTGYMASYIESYYKKNRTKAQLYFAKESKPLGTGGAVKYAASLVNSDPFFVLNGDSFCDIDLKDFLEFHLKNKAAASILLSRIPDVKEYGSVAVNKDGKIRSFKEKTAKSPTNLVNAGIYLFNKDILKQIPAGIKASLECDIFPVIHGLYGYITDTGFIDIGVKERYDKAKIELKPGS